MSTEAVAGSPGAQLAQFRERLTSLAAGFSARQRRTLVVTGALVVAMVLAVSWFRNQVEWAPLYTQLETADASALTQKLTEKGVPWAYYYVDLPFIGLIGNQIEPGHSFFIEELFAALQAQGRA